MPFWRLYYHAVWATKLREPLILDRMIVPITEAIAQTMRDRKVTVFAVGILPDHIHVLAQIPPSINVAEVIGRWKGASSHAANEACWQGTTRLSWQTGYGVLSVSQKGLEPVREYVLNQRERHAQSRLYGVMERCEDGPEI
jgi:putative transposase